MTRLGASWTVVYGAAELADALRESVVCWPPRHARPASAASSPTTKAPPSRDGERAHATKRAQSHTHTTAAAWKI